MKNKCVNEWDNVEEFYEQINTKQEGKVKCYGRSCRGSEVELAEL